DPKLDDVKRVVVDLRPVQRLPLPVSLAQIKKDSSFADFDLLRLPRLSVVPVSELHWERLLQLSKQ
ncbi:ubiquinol-cytochrome C reductase, partial [Fischerella thermalis WC217]